MKRRSLTALLLCCLYGFSPISLANTAVDKSSERDIYDNHSKNADDPTLIRTSFGFAGNYNFESDNFGYSISGSIGLSEAQKINVRFHPDTDEWRLGGSWLFDFGIVNFNFGKSEYDDGANYNNYSIGTFIPLSVFGIEPNGWQIFPMAGFNYTEGERPLNEAEPDYDIDNPYVMHPTQSKGGYLGFFSLKPIDDALTVMTFAGASAGSNDYFGYWFGVGLGYEVTQQDSISLLGLASDNDYGSDQKVILSYTHNF